jgi:GTP-binding protein EngB required for normal cell division
VLELKSVADVALIGYPSAGKSSLIAAMSAAKPKIADYPFTTLVPNLGVVQSAGHVFTIADVPGLIPGASEGKGLGHEFLRHIERCAVLVHVLDCATLEPERDPISDLDAIEAELAAYEAKIPDDQHGEYGRLTERPRLVVLNKTDIPDGKDLAELVRTELEGRGLRVFEVSAVSHAGLKELGYALAEIVEQARAERPEVVQERIILRPTAVDEAPFTLHFEDEHYVVLSTKAERWIADRLPERRGRRLPRRAALQARRRAGAARGGRARGRRGRHRRRGRRGGLRLAPDPLRRRRAPRPARLRRPALRLPTRALMPTTPIAAARSSPSPSGIGTQAVSCASVYCARVPSTKPPGTDTRIRVPGAKVSLSTTRPTPSTPGTYPGFGLPSGCAPEAMSRSTGLTAAAVTWTRLTPGVRRGSSRSSLMPGACPSSLTTAARIAVRRPLHIASADHRFDDRPVSHSSVLTPCGQRLTRHPAARHRVRRQNGPTSGNARKTVGGGLSWIT